MNTRRASSNMYTFTSRTETDDLFCLFTNENFNETGCLMMSVSLNLKRQMIGRILSIMYLETMDLGICLEGLKKAIKNVIHDILSPNQNLNPGFSNAVLECCPVDCERKEVVMV
jgi:hypothetical protein